MCTPLAGGIRGKPSPTRGLARHSRGRSGPLLTRRSQTLCSGPGVTAREMKYFEEGHHDRRTDRRSQLMMFVSFVNEFRPLKGAVAELVGNEGGVVSGVFNLESSGVEASDWRPRHDEHYHEA